MDIHFKVFKKMIRLIRTGKFIRFLASGFSECAECERYSKCDKKPWLRRLEDGCNYGRLHNHFKAGGRDES